MWAMTIGSKFGVEHLRQVEKPCPQPGPHEVLIRVRAVSLNYRDWEVINGRYHEVFPHGLVPMSDGAGDVVACGAQVTDLQVGDKVMGCFWQGWQAGDSTQALSAKSLGGPLGGMFSEYVVLPASGVLRIPAGLTHAQAACLPCAGVTAWHALVSEGQIKVGDWVLVQGTGGVSLFAMQFAKLHGARVMLLSSSASKEARARELGADLTLNYRDVPQWGAEVARLTGGVQHVVEVGGPGTFAQSFAALAPGGQINMIGYLGGKEGQVSPMQILQTQARIRGVAVGPRSSAEAMCRAYEAGCAPPVIDRSYPLAETSAAFSRLEAGEHMGKLVVHW